MQIKNIPTGAGETINLRAVYTDGATCYNIQNLSPNSYAKFGDTGLAGAYQSVGFANAPDAVYTGTTAANGTSLENIRTWGFRGGYNHNWDPYWSSGLYVANAQVKYGNLGRTAICVNAAVLLGLLGTCNPDFNIAQVGMITRWTPVKGLTFSADVAWTRSTRSTLVPCFPAPRGSGEAGAVYELRDQDSIVMLLRAQRNW